MHIKKLIKIYFSFIICALVTASIFYSNNTSQFFANVFTATQEDNNDFSFKAFVSTIPTLEKYASYIPEKKDIELNILNDPTKAFALPGAENVEIMQLKFSAKKTTDIKEINFKIYGVDSGSVKTAVLMDEEKSLEKVSPSGNKLVFDDIDIHLEPNSERTLSVKLTLSTFLKSSDRIRLDIEKSEDLKILVNDKLYQFKEEFPLKGKYLSIVYLRKSINRKSLD